MRTAHMAASSTFRQALFEAPSGLAAWYTLDPRHIRLFKGVPSAGPGSIWASYKTRMVTEASAELLQEHDIKHGGAAGRAEAAERRSFTFLNATDSICAEAHARLKQTAEMALRHPRSTRQQASACAFRSIRTLPSGWYLRYG